MSINTSQMSDSIEEIIDVIEKANKGTLIIEKNNVFYSQKIRFVTSFVVFFLFTVIFCWIILLAAKKGENFIMPIIFTLMFTFGAYDSFNKIRLNQYILMLDNFLIISSIGKGIFNVKHSNINRLELKKRKSTFLNMLMGLLYGPIGYIMAGAMFSGYDLSITKKDGSAFELDMDDLKLSGKFLDVIQSYCNVKGIPIDILNG